MAIQIAGQIPVLEGLFALDPKESRLSGTPCTSCGTPYFLRAISCSTPDGEEKEVEPSHLGR